MDPGASNNSSTDFVFRSCCWTYIVFSMICGTVSFLSVSVAFTNPAAFWYGGSAGRPFWQAAACVLAIWLYCLVWIRSFKVSVVKGTLSYRSLLGGTRSIPLGEIQDSKTEIGWFNYVGKSRPPFRIVVMPRAETQLKPIIINMRVFAKEDIARLLDTLNVSKNKCRYGVFEKE